jgi:predicted acyl esterase
VAIGLVDVGHSRANNPPYEWRHLNDQAWQFLQSNINRSHRQQTTVFSMPSACVRTGQSDEAQAIVQLTGSTPQDLSRGTLSVQYAQGDTLTNYKPPTLDPDNEATDPVTGFLSVSGCRKSAAPTFDPTLRYTARSAQLTQPVTYVGLGFVRVTYALTPSAGPTTAELNARVWDQSPDGTDTLMTRGTYRIDGPGYDTVPSGTIDLPLFGNHWRLQPGHRVRLDMTQVDFPTFLYSNQVTSVSFAPPLLVLPTREASNRVISGS